MPAAELMKDFMSEIEIGIAIGARDRWLREVLTEVVPQPPGPPGIDWIFAA